MLGPYQSLLRQKSEDSTDTKTCKTRKLSYRKDDRAMRHIHGCPEKNYLISAGVTFPPFKVIQGH